jgi:glycosyltransferase involved in cell wall biosynthesis
VYATHDCFVYPGIWEEPLGRVYLEALASGTPIVTSAYGSIGEVVGDAGRLTDGSVADFRRTLLETVRAGRLTEMSAAARRRADDFGLETVVEDIEALYASLLAD